jgi:hypothetical protein
MSVLLIIGVVAFVFGVLLFFAPQVINRMTIWSNRVIAATDEYVSGNNKAAGAILIVAGLFILGVVFLRK